MELKIGRMDGMMEKEEAKKMAAKKWKQTKCLQTKCLQTKCLSSLIHTRDEMRSE